MWALGIPTTRAASLVVTDTLADRDQFYNGNVKKEKCALVLRLSPTFWRFGSFEIFKPSAEGREGPRYESLILSFLIWLVLDWKKI